MHCMAHRPLCLVLGICSSRSPASDQGNDGCGWNSGGPPCPFLLSCSTIMCPSSLSPQPKTERVTAPFNPHALLIPLGAHTCVLGASPTRVLLDLRCCLTSSRILKQHRHFPVRASAPSTFVALQLSPAAADHRLHLGLTH